MRLFDLRGRWGRPGAMQPPTAWHSNIPIHACNPTQRDSHTHDWPRPVPAVQYSMASSCCCSLPWYTPPLLYRRPLRPLSCRPLAVVRPASPPMPTLTLPAPHADGLPPDPPAQVGHCRGRVHVESRRGRHPGAAPGGLAALSRSAELGGESWHNRPCACAHLSTPRMPSCFGPCLLVLPLACMHGGDTCDHHQAAAWRAYRS